MIQTISIIDSKYLSCFIKYFHDLRKRRLKHLQNMEVTFQQKIELMKIEGRKFKSDILFKQFYLFFVKCIKKGDLNLKTKFIFLILFRLYLFVLIDHD